MFATRSPCVVGILQNQSANHHHCLFGVPTYEVSKLMVSKEKNKNIDKQHFTLRLYFLSLIYISIFHMSSLLKKLSYNG